MTSGGVIEACKIVLFSMGAAIAYGLVHDQITAHLCVEYFSVAHPPVIPTDSPFLLALVWGVLATWWVGLILGLALAAAARIGPAPRLDLNDVRPLMVRLMLYSGLGAVVAGIIGAILVATGSAPVPGGWGDVIPTDKHTAFSADAWAHTASYAVGGLGGLVVIALALRKRLRGAPLSP